MLTAEGRVAGDTLDEGTEDRADTDTSASEADGGEASTLHLGGGDDGGSGGLSDDAALLDGVAGNAAGHVVGTGAVHEQAAADGRLAGLLQEGALEAGGAWR